MQQRIQLEKRFSRYSLSKRFCRAGPHSLDSFDECLILPLGVQTSPQARIFHFLNLFHPFKFKQTKNFVTKTKNLDVFPWENIADPVMVEARACLQAITMAEEMGFQDICVEGDTLTIIHKLNSREANKAAHGMAIEGCRHENPQY